MNARSQVLAQLSVWLCPHLFPMTVCPNGLLLPEMLRMAVHRATTHSCKETCLLAISSGRSQVLISYSTRKESTLLSYDLLKKNNLLAILIRHVKRGENGYIIYVDIILPDKLQ